MQSSRLWLFAFLFSPAAVAQTAAPGFALERFSPSAPGAGWFVMDALDMNGGLGGAMSLTASYARNPLRIGSGPGAFSVVSDEAVLTFGVGLTYENWRIYLDVDAPLLIQGQSGTADGYSFTAPAITLESNPDTLSDPRIGADVRLFGMPGESFRVGVSSQLFIPNGDTADYDSDGTLRAMLRVLVAGDLGAYSYAAQLGVHVRPRDDSPTPGGPHGSELLFGVAAGRTFDVATGWALVVGPEIYGQSALESLFGAHATGTEALLTGRMEGKGAGARFRIKLGVGGGLDAQFGAPQFRVLAGIEYFNRGQPLTGTAEATPSADASGR